MVEVIMEITTDEELQKAFALDELIPNSIKIKNRLFFDVPIADLDKDVGILKIVDGEKVVEEGKKVSEEYKVFYSDKDKATLMYGENDGYGSKLSGSRNLQTNPITGEEIKGLVALYGIENMHIDYTRKVIKEITKG